MIRAEVRYTKEYFKALISNLPNFKKLTVYFGFVSAVCAVMPIMMAVIYGNGIREVSPAPFIVPAIFILWIVYINLIYPGSALKKYQERYPDSVINITFNESCVFTELKGDNLLEQTSYGYDKFICAKETKKFFFLNLTKNSAIIISKDDLIDCTQDDIRNLFKEKFGKKFKIK